MLFGNKEPWQIAAITTSTILSLFWLWDLINQDEDLYIRAKKKFFKLSRKIPYVQKKIDEEIGKIAKGFEEDIQKSNEGLDYYLDLPPKGLTRGEVMDVFEKYSNLGHYNWKSGKVSGAVYDFDENIVNLVTEVYGKASYTNPLHADVFPGICKMEAEVVRMACNLFQGGPESCGAMTTGGTESIIMAVKAFRDYARDVKGITRPNIVAPVTAHVAFNKAGLYFGAHVHSVKLNPETYTVDIKAMERAINRNTIMLVGSAPNFPYGTVDDIEAIAKLGKKYNIPVHVDACLGGFLVVFMKRAGYTLRPFDFSVDGVTSISADPHKYGYTPKGASLVLYSDKKYRRYQYTVTTDWPGGVYGSPSVNGSRAGGIIAACWATLLSFGLEGYVEATKNIVDTTKYIEQGLRKIDNIFIYGTPAVSVVGIGSKKFDIYRLSQLLAERGWHLNALQFPPGIHICVTRLHTHAGVADRFVNDVRECVAEVMKAPTAPAEGKMAIYGVAQSVPDRSLVDEFTRLYIDSTYYTPPAK